MTSRQLRFGARKRPLWRRVGRGVLLALAVVTLVLAVEEIAYRFQDSDVRSSGPNAIWLRRQWVDEDRSELQYKTLISRLHRMNVADVYFHAGPLEGNGSIRQAKLDGSARFIRRMKKLDPKIRLQPWLGQVAEFGGGGPLDLRSRKVRGEIVSTAHRFLELGADGFHIDLEPIYTGDADYLQLLRKLRKLTRSHKAMLSIAAYKPEEFRGIEWVSSLIAPNPGYWTKDYFLAIAKEVDQVAIMSYDSGIPLPGLYGRSVAWAAEWSVDSGLKSVYIGIPSYEAGGHAHFTWAENLGNSLHGLRLGVSRLPKSDRHKVGAAVFAEWTTSREEEETFTRKWVRR